MLTLQQYKYINEVKGSNSFTKDQSLREYINGVKYRMSQWYGYEVHQITDLQVYLELVKHPNLKN